MAWRKLRLHRPKRWESSNGSVSSDAPMGNQMVEIDAFTGHNGVADRYAIALAGRPSWSGRAPFNLAGMGVA